MPSLSSRLLRASLVRALTLLRVGDISPDTAIGDIDIQAYRDRFERLATRARFPDRVTITTENDAPVPGEWVVDRNAEPDRVVLWIHGGAHCMCSPRTHRGLGYAMSRGGRARVFVPDYRLAPEDPFPAGRDDLVEVYRWLLDDRRIDPARLVVGGDSSGGGLALSLLVHLKDLGLPQPACTVLLSPWVDLTLSMESWQPGVIDDPWLPAELGHLPVDAYRGDLPADDPGVSPLFADLKGLPPMLVHVGSDELLIDEGKDLVRRAREVGVQADVGVFHGMWHVFHAFPGMPEARRALREIGGFIRRHTSPSEAPASL